MDRERRGPVVVVLRDSPLLLVALAVALGVAGALVLWLAEPKTPQVPLPEPPTLPCRHVPLAPCDPLKDPLRPLVLPQGEAGGPAAGRYYSDTVRTPTAAEMPEVLRQVERCRAAGLGEVRAVPLAGVGRQLACNNLLLQAWLHEHRPRDPGSAVAVASLVEASVPRVPRAGT